MSLKERCFSCNRVKKDFIQCISCNTMTCVLCVVKKYSDENTPFNEYFHCLKCKSLYDFDLPKKCTYAFNQKIYSIIDKLDNTHYILNVSHPFIYINQLWLAGKPFIESEITQMVDDLHESFFSARTYEMPRILPRLPVKRRLLKPGAPPALIEFERYRCPVLSGSLAELYEAHSSGTVVDLIKSDYANRKINARVDKYITDFENNLISEWQLPYFASLGKFSDHCQYNDDGEKISKPSLTEDASDEATEAVV